jgi:anti-sigma B factor antagonist
MRILDIQERRVGEVTILDLDGDITISGGNITLQKAIRSQVEEGRNQIVLNLGRVNYIDSSGLGELVAGHDLLNKEFGRIKLINLTKRVLDLMMLTKLNTVFDIYDNESEALHSFHVKDGVAVSIGTHGRAYTSGALPLERG